MAFSLNAHRLHSIKIYRENSGLDAWYKIDMIDRDGARETITAFNNAHDDLPVLELADNVEIKRPLRVGFMLADNSYMDDMSKAMVYLTEAKALLKGHENTKDIPADAISDLEYWIDLENDRVSEENQEPTERDTRGARDA